MCQNKTTSNIRWSSKLAYAIGLLTTDGNLSKDGRHIDFTSKDIELINLLKKCLSLKNKIGYKTSGYSKRLYPRIQFGDVKLYNFLKHIGLTPNKSKTLNELHIPSRYMADFLRGLIDGDGSIIRYKDKIYPNSERLYTAFTSASIQHIKWLAKTIELLYGMVGKVKSCKRAWQLVYAKEKSITLLNKIYYNRRVPSLTRKRSLAEKYLYSHY
jgi:hypothetical protein